MTIWGNHSATQYPDLFHAEVNGKNAAELDRRPGLDRRRRSSPPCSSAAPPSSRPGACRARRRRPTPPSTTCTPGSRHRRGRLGVDGHPDRRQLRRARGAHVVVPGDHAPTASTRSSRASTSTTTPAARSTPRSPSWPRSATPSPSSASSEPSTRRGRSPARGRRRRRSRRYLRNLLGGVVGQHLAAGLAGGAVVHRVARCTRPRGRRRRTPGRSRRSGGAPRPGRSFDELMSSRPRS